MTRVNTLSLDMQRSNNDVFSLQSHGKIIKFIFLRNAYTTSSSENYHFFSQAEIVVTSKRH